MSNLRQHIRRTFYKNNSKAEKIHHINIPSLLYRKYAQTVALNLHLIKIFNQNTKEGEMKISHIYEAPIPFFQIFSNFRHTQSGKKNIIHFLLCQTLIFIRIYLREVKIKQPWQ